MMLTLVTHYICTSENENVHVKDFNWGFSPDAFSLKHDLEEEERWTGEPGIKVRSEA